MRQLGTPPGWSSETTPADALGPMIHGAAERARTLAMANVEQVVAPETAVRAEQSEEKAATKKATVKQTPARQPRKRATPTSTTATTVTKPARTKTKTQKTARSRAKR